MNRKGIIELQVVVIFVFLEGYRFQLVESEKYVSVIVYDNYINFFVRFRYNYVFVFFQFF